MAGHGIIELWGDKLWESPYVFTVFVSLREKRLPFDVHEVDLDAKQQLRPDYRQRTLTARVPALQHDGFLLTESTAIVEYLEEQFPAPATASVLPTNVRDRARARQILSWLRSDLMPLREERPTSTMFYARATRPLSAAAGAAADKLVAVAEALVPADAGPLFGEWCIADADLAFCLHRLISNQDKLPDRLVRYAAAQWQRPSVREYVEHARPAV